MRLKGSRKEEEARQEVHEDDERDRRERPIALLQEGEQAEEHAGHRREDEHEDPEVHIPRRGEADELGEQAARRDRLRGEAPRTEGLEDEPEEDQGNGQDDAGAEHMVDESVDVLDFRKDRAPQVPHAHLDGTERDAWGDHRATPFPNARRPMRMPRTTRKTANTKRTRWAFARTRSLVPMFVPENTPTITIAARLGSTKPAE